MALLHWYGEGGHPKAPAGGCYAEGERASYKVVPRQAAPGFLAERGVNGSWETIGACDTAYEGTLICERDDSGVVAPKEPVYEYTIGIDYALSTPEPEEPPLTGLARIRAARERMKK